MKKKQQLDVLYLGIRVLTSAKYHVIFGDGMSWWEHDVIREIFDHALAALNAEANLIGTSLQTHV